MSRRMMSALFAAVVCGLVAPRARAAQEVIHRLRGPDKPGQFGLGLSSIGDLDGDGVRDLLIGAPAAGAAREGKAHVLSGRTGAYLHTFNGEVAFDLFGTHVRGLGDLNGDGVGEFFIAAPGSDASGWTESGRGYIYSGARGLRSDFELIRISDGWGRENSYGDAFLAGDLDADGVEDYGVVAWKYPNYSPSLRGRVAFYSGRSGQELYSLLGEGSQHRLGWNRSSLSDVNGDGVCDFVTTAPNRRVYLHSGVSGALLRTWEADGTPGVGNGLSGVGDLDGDGVEDIAMGDIGDYGAFGAVRVVSPVGDHVFFETRGLDENGWYGEVVEGLGDLNRDGFPDYAVGAPLDDRGGFVAGASYVYSGRSGALMASFVGPGSDRMHGHAIERAGDLNQDGYPDFMISSPVTASRGVVVVYSGHDVFLQGDVVEQSDHHDLVLHSRGGPPFSRSWVQLLSVDGWDFPVGAPWIVATGALDADGNWSSTVDAPPNLWGQTLNFQAFCLRPDQGGTGPAHLKQTPLLTSSVLSLRLEE